MTTAEQLMGDREFLSRRVQEQDDYMHRLHVRLYENQIDYNRYVELGESAMYQRAIFESHLNGLSFFHRLQKSKLRAKNSDFSGIEFVPKNEESYFGPVTKPGHTI